jgi:hypothetical protein
MNLIQKVRSVLDDLKSGKKPAQAGENWALASRLLTRMTSDMPRINKIIGAKDLEGLDKLLLEIEGKVAATAAADSAVNFSDSLMNDAMKAFHKRISIGRLADESRLGGRYTSGGRKSNIDGIQPPDGFDVRIWPALVRAGKLKDLGQGFYAEANPGH